jgi:phospholipase/carboxylesterase
MTRTLRDLHRAPAGGAADSLMVLLHGYGADGADLIGLADPLAQHLPGTAFAAPDAPEPCVANPAGRQWFAIPRFDGATEAMAAAGLAAAARDLDAWLDATMAATGVADDRTLLVGFSQGTMMALHVALRRPQPLAGVVGFSGRLLDPAGLAGAIRSRPPVLLLHGDMDDVVPPAAMPEAEAALRGAGVDVATHVMARTGHSIAPDGLALALAFARTRLGY